MNQPSGEGHAHFLNAAFIYLGNDLLSHTLSRAVPSAQRGLTSVFGMGISCSGRKQVPLSLSRSRVGMAGLLWLSEDRVGDPLPPGRIAPPHVYREALANDQ
jgi:hypothetical protein